MAQALSQVEFHSVGIVLFHSLDGGVQVPQGGSARGVVQIADPLVEGVGGLAVMLYPGSVLILPAQGGASGAAVRLAGPEHVCRSPCGILFYSVAVLDVQGQVKQASAVPALQALLQ